MDTTLAAGVSTIAVASLVFWMARAFAKMLTVQGTLTRVLGVVDARDWS